MLENFEFLGEADKHRLLLQDRWWKSIGDMLAFISDELHPRGFEQIIADDYRGVQY